MQNSLNMMVSAGLGPSSTSGLGQKSTNGWEVDSPNYVLRVVTIEDGELTSGLDSSNRTPQWRTLELATRIGHRSICVLVDSGSTSDYVDT